jgi:membrane protein YdbS with pleckstrin-like domain
VLLIVLLGLPLLLGVLLIAVWLLVHLPLVIYLSAYYKTLEYSIDSDALRIKKGVFWRRRTTVPFAKITNIDITQGPVERMFKISTLHVQTAGSSSSEFAKAEIVIPGIRDSETLKDAIVNQIRPSSHTAQVPVAEKASESETLMDILSELKGIRAELSRKHSS